MYRDMFVKLGKFLWFSSCEGNKYVSDELSQKSEHFVDSVHKLDGFTGAHFYPVESRPQSPAKDELWIPTKHRFKEDWEEEIWQIYHKLEPELHGLARAMLEAYKSYRATARETLLV